MISPEKPEPRHNPLPSQKARKENEHLKFGTLDLTVFPEVYFPYEDSFMLAKAAAQHAFGKTLDLGCGSGVAGLSAAENDNVTEIIFSDISKKALENAGMNAERNKQTKSQKFKFILSNLFSRMQTEKFDTICFNPPYLPTSSEEKLKGEINDAFDGGEDGRKVIDPFLSEFSSHLSEKGILLYLNSSRSGTEKTLSILKEKHFKHEKLSSLKYFFEEISVFKVHK